MAAPADKKQKVELPDEASYVLKVSVGPEAAVATREVEAGAHHTLQELETALLQSFKYPPGRVNAFYLDGKPLSKAKDATFYSDAGPIPKMLSRSLKQANPAANTKWAYLYDLQANVPVEVTLVVSEVKPVGKALDNVTVTKSEGDAPPAPAEEDDQEEDEISEEEEEEDDGDNYEEEEEDEDESEESEKKKPKAKGKRGRRDSDSDD